MNKIWAVKMIWFHGFYAVKVFRINRAIAKTDSVLHAAQISEHLDRYKGTGWFGGTGRLADKPKDKTP